MDSFDIIHELVTKLFEAEKLAKQLLTTHKHYSLLAKDRFSDPNFDIMKAILHQIKTAQLLLVLLEVHWR